MTPEPFHLFLARHTLLLWLAGTATVGAVVGVVLVDWRWRVRHQRNMQIGRALGDNLGLDKTELKELSPPKIVYDHGRMVKVTVTSPACLIGDMVVGDRRAEAEQKMQATVHGMMGHVSFVWRPAVSKRVHASVTLERAPQPKPIPERVAAADITVIVDRLLLPVGVAAGGRVVFWNVRPRGDGVAHCLIAGATGNGKTEAVMTLAGAALDRGHLVYVVDPKADDFEEWKEDGVCPVATTADTAARMVAGIRRERERRVQDYPKHRRMAMLASGELPSIFVVIDEMQSFLEQAGWSPRKPPQVMSDLLNLAQQGRSVGVHLIVGTQYPKVDAVGGGDFRNQLEMVVGLGFLTTEARGLTRIKGSLSAFPPGRAIVAYPGTEVEVQVALAEPRKVSSAEPRNEAGDRLNGRRPSDAVPAVHVGVDVGGVSDMPAGGAALLPGSAPGYARLWAAVHDPALQHADGTPNKHAVARELGVSPRTVRRQLMLLEQLTESGVADGV